MTKASPVALVLSLAVIGCGSGRTNVTTVSAPAGRAAAPPEATATDRQMVPAQPDAPPAAIAAQPSTPSFRELRREPDLVLRPSELRPRVRPIAGSASALVTHDRAKVLIHTLGGIWRHGADLRREGPILVPTDRSAVERPALSPDDAWVAAAVRGSRLVVAAVADGRVLRSIDGPDLADALVAVSPTKLAFRRGCRLFLLEVLGAGEPSPVGPEVCGLVRAMGLRDGAVWLASGTTVFGVRALSAIDLATGSAQILVEAPGPEDFYDIAVAAAGTRLCWTLPVADNTADLYCADRPRERAWHVATGITGPLTLSASGERLLYLTAGDGGRDVVLVDFQAGTVRRVATSRPFEWWTFLPGETRIVGHGALNGAEVIDLAEGWSLHIGGRREEWEDVDTVPGDDDQFFIRRDSSRPALHHVDLGPR